MSVDELVEIIAKVMHRRGDRDWEGESEEIQSRYRSMAYAAWPLVVWFVAAWLERTVGQCESEQWMGAFGTREVNQMLREMGLEQP